MKFPLDFYTSYSQFYIYDKDSEGATASDTFWTNDAFNDRLAIETGVLGVGTECYGPVKAELEILNMSANVTDPDGYDHIVEAGIEVKSGIIQIINCPDWTVQLEVEVDPGFYRARIYSSNLASVEGDEGDDFYRIEIWLDKNMARKVLKRYTPYNYN